MKVGDEDMAMDRLRAYAKRSGLSLTRYLGSGIHGVAWEAEGNAFPGLVAIKAHRNATAYRLERDAYRRLRDEGISGICGLNVPLLLGWDDELLVIQITVVQPPFLLDFGEAYLDLDPEFPDDVWVQWEQKLDEMFGEQADEVRRVLAVLHSYGIILLDVNPANLRFG